MRASVAVRLHRADGHAITAAASALKSSGSERWDWAPVHGHTAPPREYDRKVADGQRFPLDESIAGGRFPSPEGSLGTRRPTGAAPPSPCNSNSPPASRHGGGWPSRLWAKKTHPIQCLHQPLQGVRRRVPVLAHDAGHDGLAQSRLSGKIRTRDGLRSDGGLDPSFLFSNDIHGQASSIDSRTLQWTECSAVKKQQAIK